MGTQDAKCCERHVHFLFLLKYPLFFSNIFFKVYTDFASKFYSLHPYHPPLNWSDSSLFSPLAENAPFSSFTIPAPDKQLSQLDQSLSLTSLARTQAIALQRSYVLHPPRVHCSPRAALLLKRDHILGLLHQTSMFGHQGSIRKASEGVDLSPPRNTLRLIWVKDPIWQDGTKWPPKTEICPCALRHVLSDICWAQLKKFSIIRSFMTPHSAVETDAHTASISLCFQHCLLHMLAESKRTHAHHLLLSYATEFSWYFIWEICKFGKLTPRNDGRSRAEFLLKCHPNNRCSLLNHKCQLVDLHILMSCMLGRQEL